MTQTLENARPGWETIHSSEVSWREKIIGPINEAFVVPRYVRLFYDTFGRGRDQSFFEIGSGMGDLSHAILAANRGEIGRYVTSEYFPDGVAWLRRRGLEAVQADAMRLPPGDAQFDASVAFDVMHHVDRPREMAREMMRIARGRCLLVESNGWSVVRKLKEFTPAHRAAGERSYLPRGYRSFFMGHPGYWLTRFMIYPFLFPFKCPRWALPGLVWFNGAIERIPVARWQCSSVAIVVEYERDGKGRDGKGTVPFSAGDAGDARGTVPFSSNENWDSPRNENWDSPPEVDCHE
jgi:SAM-dependent methyltransferase